jgi:hypothetical protein
VAPNAGEDCTRWHMGNLYSRSPWSWPGQTPDVGLSEFNIMFAHMEEYLPRCLDDLMKSYLPYSSRLNNTQQPPSESTCRKALEHRKYGRQVLSEFCFASWLYSQRSREYMMRIIVRDRGEQVIKVPAIIPFYPFQGCLELWRWVGRYAAAGGNSHDSDYTINRKLKNAALVGRLRRLRSPLENRGKAAGTRHPLSAYRPPYSNRSTLD